jgi:hypothetical protein
MWMVQSLFVGPGVRNCEGQKATEGDCGGRGGYIFEQKVELFVEVQEAPSANQRNPQKACQFTFPQTKIANSTFTAE